MQGTPCWCSCTWAPTWRPEIGKNICRSLLYGGPKVSRQFQLHHGNFNLTTAISIWSRQFQFGHGNFNFTHGNFNLVTAISTSLTAISIWSRLFQLRSRQFQFDHGNFNFTHGNFNLVTAISI